MNCGRLSPRLLGAAAIVLAAVAVGAAGIAAGEEAAASKASPAGDPGWRLACRVSNYGKYQASAWTHLPSIGVRHVFIGVPPPGEVAAVQKRLADSRLAALVMRGDADLGRPSSVDELALQLAACEKMGVRYLFLSPKHPGADKEVACDRLRRAGEIARRHGVTITLETHPDLGTNGDVHLETMRRINHPNVRVNFDTGNVTFYNKNADAVTELKKIIDYVATVELKDHDGQFQTWHFPTLGKGIVDFPAVLRVLKEHRYRGPITMEVEGVSGTELDEAETKKYVADSVAYLRSLAEFR